MVWINGSSRQIDCNECVHKRDGAVAEDSVSSFEEPAAKQREQASPSYSMKRQLPQALIICIHTQYHIFNISGVSACLRLWGSAQAIGHSLRIDADQLPPNLKPPSNPRPVGIA